MSFPLSQVYPGIDGLPRLPIASVPTPLDDAADVAASHGIASLSLKRDDLSNPVYGGNKVRKLEYLLGQARAENRRAVITFGAYGSNHALATAVHATAAGIEPHVVLSPQAPGPYARATLLAHAGIGSHLHPVDGWDGLREAVRVRQELTARDGVEPLVIPMGGSSDRGTVGYVNAAFEIAEQIAESAAARPDLVYCALGTMSTAVGLAIGFAALRWSTEVIGVRVTPDEVANEAFARKLTVDTVALLRGLDPAFPELDFEDLALDLRDDWFEPGYGVPTPETTAAVQSAAGFGYRLETTYTGKALAAMMDDARQGLLEHENVVFLDTYNSAPMPAPGSVESLPEVLRAYVDECERLFGDSAKALKE